MMRGPAVRTASRIEPASIFILLDIGLDAQIVEAQLVAIINRLVKRGQHPGQALVAV